MHAVVGACLRLPTGAAAAAAAAPEAETFSGPQDVI
jgi:hypothetical protein